MCSLIAPELLPYAEPLSILLANAWRQASSYVVFSYGTEQDCHSLQDGVLETVRVSIL